MFLHLFVGYQEVVAEGDIAVDEGLMPTGTLPTAEDLVVGE
jgi:hypothetical protein